MQKACDSFRRARPLLGTLVEITVADAGHGDAEAAIEAAFGAVETAHHLMSFHEAASDVSRLNREAHADAVVVHPWTCEVLATACELHGRSRGVFDIAVAPALQRMQLLPGAAGARDGSMQHATTASLELLAGRVVRFRRPDLQIDLGGIAKGYAVDRAIEVLQSRGMAAAVVNAGGDLAAFGADAHTVHLRDPRHPDRMLATAKIANEALATSGLRFDPFQSAVPMTSAVIDPATQYPARGSHGATVRARSCMLADALTKVVMLACEESAAVLAHYGASALFITTDGDVRLTSDWQDAFGLAA